MTPKQFREARRKLGLSVNQMAAILEIKPLQVRRFEIEKGLNSHRDVHPATAKLMRAYLDGYRPKDWPQENAQ